MYIHRNINFAGKAFRWLPASSPSKFTVKHAGAQSAPPPADFEMTQRCSLRIKFPAMYCKSYSWTIHAVMDIRLIIHEILIAIDSRHIIEGSRDRIPIQSDHIPCIFRCLGPCNCHLASCDFAICDLRFCSASCGLQFAISGLVCVFWSAISGLWVTTCELRFAGYNWGLRLSLRFGVGGLRFSICGLFCAFCALWFAICKLRLRLAVGRLRFMVCGLSLRFTVCDCDLRFAIYG